MKNVHFSAGHTLGTELKSKVLASFNPPLKASDVGVIVLTLI